MLVNHLDCIQVKTENRHGFVVAFCKLKFVCSFLCQESALIIHFFNSDLIGYSDLIITVTDLQNNEASNIGIENLSS